MKNLSSREHLKLGGSFPVHALPELSDSFKDKIPRKEAIHFEHLISTSLGMPLVTTYLKSKFIESDSLLEEESVLNADGQIINLLDLSIYASTLQHEDRCRYAAKLLLVACYCPYTIHEEYWCIGLTISVPQVTNLDLVNYLRRRS
ncbi:Uncharacterized protein APZ42_033044 [Daphnia magna]|uniref:Uncharacterized protein n=1 Tax=Daphnia magna TaxID=35525 RepID=A0A162F221_9CRUS|nr:Uncharacterized protein APZ42_033044 [Daphnia magna]